MYMSLTKTDGREHILACMSASPTNEKIIRTAAKMAKAFDGAFTALYVRTADADAMSDADKKRLQHHMRLAESLGADVATVYGDDISLQIAEFARISGITTIVIGRSSVKRRHIWSRPALTETLADIAPNLDIHIIPDIVSENKYRERKKIFSHEIIPSARDLLITLLMLACVSAIGSAFRAWGFTEANIITVYILGVLLVSLFTKSYICSIISSLMSVLLFNFFFTEPRLTFHAYESGYPVTFGIMLAASLLTGTLANKLKNHAKQSAQAAFRAKVLFDTNQLLQKAKDDNDILNTTARQIMKLSNRDIIAYPAFDGKLGNGKIFGSDTETDKSVFFSSVETEAAEWTFRNIKRSGASARIFPDAKCLYLAVRINSRAYGVIGIHTDGKPLDSFENSIILSILGECALAIENNHNARDKEEAAVRANNEQLRANLLRAISHDLRTPLTSISGNADNLLSNSAGLDDETKKQIYTDIYDDSMWLINLVENLLSITRVDEGRLNFNSSCEVVEDLIEEATRHIDRKSGEHNISVNIKDEFMLVKADARLIVQVIINIVDNAVKYTPAGSSIVITAEKADNNAVVSIADTGAGIPDSLKPRVFEMFFTGENKIVDSRRSLGLGLALCKSIINAHGGEISLTDNIPHGCVFSFTLPLEEVNMNE